MNEFPIGCRVVLTNLTKAEYNGKLGVVQSKLNQNGRQQVQVSFPEEEGSDATKMLGLKPGNLKLEPRPVDSLSAREMKVVLSRKNYEGSLAGYDKSELKALVDAHVSSPEEVATILAKPTSSSDAQAENSNKKGRKGGSATNLRQKMQNQAAQLNQLSPDQLRQQAQMMRTMDPNMIRRMNPAMANFSDAQVQMAATQMEQMANNPSMIEGMVNQMNNMDDNQLEQVSRMQSGGNMPDLPGATYPAATVPPNTPVQSSADNLNAGMQNMANMSPDQLRQQAAMMKSMPKDTLRQMNPLMANWPDSQIDMAIAQMESMANNPEASKSMMDQVKNMKPEELEKIRNMAQNAGLSGGQGAVGAGAAGFDPAAMAKNPMEMLNNTDPAQLKSMLSMIKDNPELFKSMMRASNPGMADQMTDEQISKTMETFANLDENKIGWLIKGLGLLQSIRSLLKKRGVLLLLSFFALIFFGLLIFVMRAKAAGNVNVVNDSVVIEEVSSTMDIPNMEEDEF